MSIRAYLFAGLGNRMFQYASAKGIAHKCGCTFDGIAAYEDNYAHQGNNYTWFMRDVLKLDGTIPMIHYDKVIETMPTYIQNISEHVGGQEISADEVRDKVLIGHFESEEFFIDIAKDIREDFKAPTYITQSIKEYLEDIGVGVADNDLCIMHIRLGDFVGNWKHFIDLTSYYLHVLNSISKTAPLIVVCEDPHNIPYVYPAVWSALNQRASSGNLVAIAPTKIELCEAFHLYIFGFAKTIACANSSFSWWGAWLNERPDKVVYMPSRANNQHNKSIGMRGAIIVPV